MSPASWFKRGVRTALSTATGRASPVAAPAIFDASDIDRICETYFTHGSAPGTPWDELRHAHMRLPAWFDARLDPFSQAYSEQQLRLWRLMSGVDRPYAAELDEKEDGWGDIDPVRTPGYFVRRDAAAVTSAGDQTIATGMILQHSGLAPGDCALEYGAGFGQTALTLARLGVNVDTVDISSLFCSFVQAQADFFKVPLQAHHGPFGMDPRPGRKYRLIWFYESFHHCLNFREVVSGLEEYLAEGGRIILGGEPIVDAENEAVPYPWGMRLHSEVVAVVRRHHWLELGFSKLFLFEVFNRAGFEGRLQPCPSSPFGTLYIFERR